MRTNSQTRLEEHPDRRHHPMPSNLFLLIVFLLLAVGISLAGFYYYQQSKSDAEAEMANGLAAISELKVSQILEWRKERLGDAALIADNPLLRDELGKWFRQPAPGPRREKILQYMRALRQHYGYSAVILFDRAQTPSLVIPEGANLPERTDEELAGRTTQERRILFSDLYVSEIRHDIHLDLAVPILDTRPDNPPVVGAVVIRIDPYKFLYPLLQRWPEPSESGESLLVRREGDEVVFLNELRHRRHTALRLRLPMNRQELPAAMGLAGQTGVVRGRDYRGVPVMAVIRFVPETNWTLVCKVDEEEIYAPLQERAGLLWALTIVLVLACGAGLGIVNRQQVAEFHRSQEARLEEHRRNLEQTMVESDILFRKVVETLPVGLYLADKSGRIISSNPAGDRIWGGTKLVDIERYGEYRARWADSGKSIPHEEWALTRAVTRGETSLDEILEIEAFDGTRKIIQNSAVPVYDDQHNLLGGFAVIQDITGRREIETRLKATNTLLDLFVHTSSREEYLRAVLELIGGWTGMDCVGIRVYGPDGNVWKEPARGFDPVFWRRSSPLTGQAGCCACLKALYERSTDLDDEVLTPGGSIWIADLRKKSYRFMPKEADTRCLCKDFGYLGLAIVPIRTPERLAGTLHLVSPEPEKPTRQAVELAETLAPILAEAIQKFEIEEELQQHRDHLEDLVQTRTLELERVNNQLRREIVERERMEQELRELERMRILAESRKEWQDTFDAITELVSIHNPDFTIRKANRAFLEHFGLSPDELSKFRCYELYHSSTCSIQDCPLQVTREAGKAAHREVYDASSSRLYMVSTYPFFSIGGEPTGIIHIAKDITAQKAREVRMILNERLASLGQMAAGIAHEINNPLATIAACAEGLLRRLREGRQEIALSQDYLSIIEEEVKRCQAITGTMLTFVRHPGEGKSRLIVHDLIDKTLAMIGHQGRLRDIQVIRDFGEDVTGVWANEGGVRQVLLALIINALDAMEDKGTLTIATAPEEEKKIQITIRDSGPGIPPESLPRIFDLFFTTKSSRGGTGLGLAIAHEIVRENQGEIRVVSPPGEGAIFTVILPTA